MTASFFVIQSKGSGLSAEPTARHESHLLQREDAEMFFFEFLTIIVSYLRYFPYLQPKTKNMMKGYFESMLPAEELSQISYIPTLGEFVEWIDKKWHDLPALSDTVRHITYGEMCDAVARKRAMLNDMGLQHGDLVAILDDSTVEAVEMFLAVTSAGYVALNLPSSLPSQAVVGCCMKFRVKVLAAGPN